jgi:hypothetical protein
MGKKYKMNDICCGVKGDYQFWESANANSIAEQYYLSRLSELAMSMFKWINLPDSVDARFLEYTLFYEGAVIFFKDKDLKAVNLSKNQQGDDGTYLALQVALGGELDVYRVPNNRRAYAVNSYNKQVTAKDSVIIWNNMIRLPEYGRMLFYAGKLAQIDRAIDVNVKGQRFPIAILCDESQRLTMKNVYKQYDGNEPFIFGDKSLDLNSIQVVNTGSPYVADKLQQLKNNIWSEAMMCLGIPNSPSEKKERLVSNEAKVSQGGTLASRSSRLEMRKRACDEINKMFGLDIDIEYNQDLDMNTEDGDSSEQEESEGFDNE